MLLRLEFCLSRGERPFSDRHLLRLRAEGLLQGRRIPFDAFSLSTQLCLFRRDGLSHALYLAADTRRLRVVAVLSCASSSCWDSTCFAVAWTSARSCWTRKSAWRDASSVAATRLSRSASSRALASRVWAFI